MEILKNVYSEFIIRLICIRLYLNFWRAIKLYLFFRLVLLLLFPWQVELGWDNSCISYYEIWFEFKLKTSPKFYTIQHIIFPVKYDLFYVQYCPFNIWKIYYSKAHFLHSMGGGSGHITLVCGHLYHSRSCVVPCLFKYWKFDIFT